MPFAISSFVRLRPRTTACMHRPLILERASKSRKARNNTLPDIGMPLCNGACGITCPVPWSWVVRHLCYQFLWDLQHDECTVENELDVCFPCPCYRVWKASRMISQARRHVRLQPFSSPLCCTEIFSRYLLAASSLFCFIEHTFWREREQSSIISTCPTLARRLRKLVVGQALTIGRARELGQSGRGGFQVSEGAPLLPACCCLQPSLAFLLTPSPSRASQSQRPQLATTTSTSLSSSLSS